MSSVLLLILNLINYVVLLLFIHKTYRPHCFYIGLHLLGYTILYMQPNAWYSINDLFIVLTKILIKVINLL